MRGLGVVALASALLCSSIADAHEIDDTFATIVEERRKQDSHIHSIGHKLRTANASFCKETHYESGILLEDAARYGDPAAIRAANAITGDIFIHSIAEGSAAARASLTAGHEVSLLSGYAVKKASFDPERSWLRVQELNAMLASFPEEMTVTLAGVDTPVTIQSDLACAGFVELVPNYSGASTDGVRVAIGRDFIGLTYPEEELAAVIAHELAHIFLGHGHWLEAHGRKRRDIRQTEREADRLMPWLLANAGYDPAAAARFMRRWGPDNNGGLRLWRKHDGWDERLAMIEAELPRISASVANRGNADWKQDFTPQFARD